MKKNKLYSLPKLYSDTAIAAFLIVLLLSSLIFRSHTLPIIWVVFAFVEVIGFFFFTTLLTKNWSRISTKIFRRKLFSIALLLRVIWVVFSYFFFIAQTGYAFDFIRADSYNYHMYAVEASNRFWQHGLDMFFMEDVGVSDQGFPLYLTIIYLLFGQSIIIPRITFAILSAWTCILIYNLARRNFGEASGRIAGIMAALLPNLIYYTGLHLKETLMVFCLVAFIERTDYLLRSNKINFSVLLIIGFLGTSLFFLRTVLAISAIFALFSAIILSRKIARNWINRLVIIFWVIIVLWVFLSAEIQQEIGYFYENQDQQEVGMLYRAEREGGNKLATYGSTAVFLPVMLMAPFPTLIDISTQQQQMMLSGAYFVRNVFAFFVIVALMFIIRKKLLRKHVFLLTFLLSYLFILAKSSFALSERFHMPVIPFLLVLAGFGISLLSKKHKMPFNLYLVVIIIIIVGWNAFKLAGRGLI